MENEVAGCVSLFYFKPCNCGVARGGWRSMYYRCYNVLCIRPLLCAIGAIPGSDDNMPRTLLMLPRMAMMANGRGCLQDTLLRLQYLLCHPL